jgi:GT2 family glycosyltransferase
MTPSISVIIVNFNTKDLIVDCVNSIKKDGPKDAEIIVVDNNSTDGSVEAIKKLSGIKTIFNDSNTGFSKANNQGIKIATGKYILLLNSDTFLTKGSLEDLMKFADEHPDAGVVGPRLLNLDKSLQDSCFRFPTIKNAILQYWFGKKGLFDKYVPGIDKPYEVDAIVGAAFLMTPKAVKELGGLDEKYFFYFEDMDYCRKVHKIGLKVYYYPKPKIVHYHGASIQKVEKEDANRWKRMIPSSKIYHGLFKHYLLTFILMIGQKWSKLYETLKKNK